MHEMTADFSSSQLPTTGASGAGALVLEFLCLFTHDLRRKQKRWQDGRLKYHAFNKRVMVYDERGNFIGDMHWRADHSIEEGEEVQLERGGILVQISECVGRQTQDLSELLDKRIQEREQRQVQAAARRRSPDARAIYPAAEQSPTNYFPAKTSTSIASRSGGHSNWTSWTGCSSLGITVRTEGQQDRYANYTR